MTTGYLESTENPIYKRIVLALGAELARSGLEILLVKPSGFTQDTYERFLEGQSDAVYISHSGVTLVQAQTADHAIRNFEHFPGKLVFLHLDAILVDRRCSSIEEASSLLQAWKRVADRSVHLCIEPADAQALREAGINNTNVIPHATEIPAGEPATEPFDFDVTFVGHVLPGKHAQTSGSGPVDQLVERLLQKRFSDSAAPLREDLAVFAENLRGQMEESVDKPLRRLACIQWLRRQVSLQSLRFRGALIEAADLDTLDIFGGDPAHLYGNDQTFFIAKPGVRCHPPVYDLAALRRTYRQSRVCINLSSPQFDYAVPNRFHDVFMSGGLCLTDRRDGLQDLTPRFEEVSFRTLGQLEDKIRYYTKPENCEHRASLIKAIQADITANSGYKYWCRQIDAALSRPCQ